MGVLGTPLLDEARSIFSDLGYTVSTDGPELRAERKWRVVYITASDPEDTPERGEFRCFVTHEDRAAALCEKLFARRPEYDWAVMGISGSGNYRIHHPGGGVPT